MSPAPPWPGRLLAALSEPRGRLPRYEGASPGLAEARAASLCSPRSVKRRGREPGLRAAAAPGERGSRRSRPLVGLDPGSIPCADRRALSAGSTATVADIFFRSFFEDGYFQIILKQSNTIYMGCILLLSWRSPLWLGYISGTPVFSLRID